MANQHTVHAPERSYMQNMMLLALRAGALEPCQLRERFGADYSKSMDALIKRGLVTRIGRGGDMEYCLSDAGRKVCLTRRALMQPVIEDGWYVKKEKNALIAKLHIAKAQLGMNEDDYRAMLRRHGAESSKDMRLDQLDAVMYEMMGKGFVAKPKAKTGRRPRVGEGREALIGKIEALLADKGAAQGQVVPWSYADALAKRLCKVERVQFCEPACLQKIITALSHDQKRRTHAG